MRANAERPPKFSVADYGFNLNIAKSSPVAVFA